MCWRPGLVLRLRGRPLGEPTKEGPRALGWPALPPREDDSGEQGRGQAVSEPSIEDIVVRIERGLRHMDAHTFPEYPMPGDLRALIASWRERGEALAALVPLCDWTASTGGALERARAALKDGTIPPSGAYKP